MRNSLLRPLLIFEFLVAIEAVFTFWSQVGGQYHLDLMYWPWKFGIGVGAALLVVVMTARVARNGGVLDRRVRIAFAALLALMVLAGVVTYYYHVYEPADQDETEDQPAIISSLWPKAALVCGQVDNAHRATRRLSFRRAGE